MTSIGKILKNIKNESFIEKVKISINLFIFFIIAKFIDTFFSYDNKIKFYYKELPFFCKIRGKILIYYFQLNSFIELYEDNKFLDQLLNSKEQVFIDVGANIGRISCLVANYNQYTKKIIALEPNINCISKSLQFIPTKLKEKIVFLNYGLGDITKDSKMVITSKDSTTTMGSLLQEKSALRDLDDTDIQKIDVRILSFQDFFEENKLSIYQNFLMKIDVEGYEEYVLKSFFNFINHNTGKYSFRIIIEILPWNVDLFEKLENFGIKKEQIKRLGNGHDYLFSIN